MKTLLKLKFNPLPGSSVNSYLFEVKLLKLLAEVLLQVVQLSQQLPNYYHQLITSPIPLLISLTTLEQQAAQNEAMV